MCVCVFSGAWFCSVDNPCTEPEPPQRDPEDSAGGGRDIPQSPVSG